MELISIVLLGGLATILIWQRFYQFGALALTAALWLFVTTWISVPFGWTLLFWLAWTIAVVAAVILRFGGGIAAASTAFFVGLVACFAGVLSPVNATASARMALPPSSSSQTVLPVTTPDGQTIAPAFVDNTAQPEVSPEAPTAGKATITPDTPVSLNCPQTLSSLNDLVACVNKQPNDKKQAYIAFFDANKGALGTSWQDVVNLAKREKETRVIVVANSGVSEQKARELARPVAGTAASTLPVVYVDGAILNTRGGIGQERIETYADNRSQVRVMLGTNATTQRNVAMAKAGRGVLTECTNVATGLVPKPKPVRVPKDKPEQPRISQPVPTSTPSTFTRTPSPSNPPSSTTLPPSSTTPPETTTPPPTTSTPPPSTSTPPTTSTPPPTTSTPPPPTTTSTPPTTTKPPTSTPPPPTTSTPPPSTSTPPPTTSTPVCPWNPELPPGHPECLKPKDPTDGPEPPPSHTLAPAPTDPPESTPPVETNPAQPTEEPGDPAPSTVTAPSATPTATVRPTHTQDPSPSETATGDVDPDGQTSTTSQADSPSATPEVPEEPTHDPAPSPEDGAEEAPPSTEALNTTMGFIGVPLLGTGLVFKRLRSKR